MLLHTAPDARTTHLGDALRAVKGMVCARIKHHLHWSGLRYSGLQLVTWRCGRPVIIFSDEDEERNIYLVVKFGITIWVVGNRAPHAEQLQLVLDLDRLHDCPGTVRKAEQADPVLGNIRQLPQILGGSIYVR